MTFICLICKEAITSDKLLSNIVNEPNENIIITTKCGHLYHGECLREYFSVQKKDDQENERRISPTLCPKCKRVVILKTTVQIYPEDDEDAYHTLLKEKSDIHRENIKLKTQIEDLRTELKVVKEGLSNQKKDNPNILATYNCNLKEGDMIVTFKEDDNESVEGIVQSIGYYNYNSLHANILFDNGDISLIPVSGLILSKDFYGASGSTNKNTLTSDVEEISDKTGDNLLNEFEISLVEFNTELNKTNSTMKRLREEVDVFSSEQIDGVTIFIESQKEKAASLRKQFISLKSPIQTLLTAQRNLADINETKSREERVNLETGEQVVQLEMERTRALEILRDTLNLYNLALPQVQQIKSFLKAGFKWLDILETNIKEILKTEFSELCHPQEDEHIAKEIQSRRLGIARITHAVEKFKGIPNSKLASTDHNLLVSAFSRFTALEAEFATRKTSLNYFSCDNKNDKNNNSSVELK